MWLFENLIQVTDCKLIDCIICFFIICMTALGSPTILWKTITVRIQISRIAKYYLYGKKCKNFTKNEKKTDGLPVAMNSSELIHRFIRWSFSMRFRILVSLYLTSEHLSHLELRFIWRSNNSLSLCSCSPIRGLTMQKCCRANCMFQRHLVTAFPTWVGFAICVFPNDYR